MQNYEYVFETETKTLRLRPRYPETKTSGYEAATI